MTSLCCDVLAALKGKSLVTAESLTGGGIGAALTQVPGSSEVYKGGIICYTNWVKENILGVPAEILERYGAVSQWTAGYLVSGVRKLLKADVAVAVTGLAGPGGDEFGHSVGTVFIGYKDPAHTVVNVYHFSGDREAVRNQTVEAALKLILKYNP
ncbi:MAG: CinA family protein [Firmicutes bacterium]|nr:CinA family protein [Bacillota bacterium]